MLITKRSISIRGFKNSASKTITKIDCRNFKNKQKKDLCPLGVKRHTSLILIANIEITTIEASTAPSKLCNPDCGKMFIWYKMPKNLDKTEHGQPPH